MYRDDRLPPRRNVDEDELQIFADAAIDAVADAIVIRICSSDADLFFFSRVCDIFSFSLEPLSVDTWVWVRDIFHKHHEARASKALDSTKLNTTFQGTRKKKQKFGSRLSSLLETFLLIRI